LPNVHVTTSGTKYAYFSRSSRADFTASAAIVVGIVVVVVVVGTDDDDDDDVTIDRGCYQCRISGVCNVSSN
jgi:hypothetical protein